MKKIKIYFTFMCVSLLAGSLEASVNREESEELECQQEAMSPSASSSNLPIIMISADSDENTQKTSGGTLPHLRAFRKIEKMIEQRLLCRDAAPGKVESALAYLKDSFKGNEEDAKWLVEDLLSSPGALLESQRTKSKELYWKGTYKQSSFGEPRERQVRFCRICERSVRII